MVNTINTQKEDLIILLHSKYLFFVFLLTFQGYKHKIKTKKKKSVLTLHDKFPIWSCLKVFKIHQLDDQKTGFKKMDKN